MNKKAWKERALQAETALHLPAPLTFDTLTICFSDKTITYRGRVITVEANCVSLPLTNDENLLAKAGWHPIWYPVSESVS